MFADIFSVPDDSLTFPCAFEDKTSIDVPVKSFMMFEVYDTKMSRDPVEIAATLPYLKASLMHDLTPIGRFALDGLDKDILDRYAMWRQNINPVLMAPIVSLCQGSGSGKTKLSLELLKRHLGFYIVFRNEGQTGYPEKNYLSDTLFNLVRKYDDPSENLESKNFDSCTVGRILNFFAIIITKYFIDLCNLCLKGVKFEDAVRELAERFQNNTEITDALLDQELMNKFYGLCKNGSKEITVKTVSYFIKEIFDSPQKFLGIYFSNGDVAASEILNTCYTKLCDALKNFPFTLVIDEAELLSKKHTSKEFKGRNLNAFEAFRRALSYFELSTKIVVLTLGTKSNVIDLNPEFVDESMRLNKRNQLPQPIVLYSNLNIFSNEFPVHKVKPTFELLSNPLFFRYLITLGHGIWSSLHYGSITDAGKYKIINGSSKTFDYVPVLWMILTGMTANSLNLNASDIVAKHMGYLLDISSDLKKLLVMFPPEPVLAIIAHKIIDNDIKSDELFSALEKKLQNSEIDHGRIAEIFGGMILIRAIWKSPVITYPVTKFPSYLECLNHIKQQAPEFNDIWEREKHILEPQSTRRQIQSEIDLIKTNLGLLDKSLEEIEALSNARKVSSVLKNRISSNIQNLKALEQKLINTPPESNLMPDYSDDYRVHSVDGFLHTIMQLPNDVSLSENYGFPKNVLEGMVNGHQIVNLDGFCETLSFKESFAPVKPEVADNRISDQSRTILTEDLLRLCIVMQLIIKFPPGYYGLDYAIPVLLKDGSFTFIGVKIKRKNANASSDIDKMRAKLHLVKCPFTHENGMNCAKCIKTSVLENIYKNQISIVLSLDEKEDFKPFSSCTKHFRGCDHEEVFDSMLVTGRDETGNDHSTISKSHDFIKPLVTHRIEVKPDILLSKSLWNDEFVNLKEIKVTKTKTIKFEPDGYIHRQFCITIKGMDNYSYLFTGFSESCRIAQKMMTPNGLSNEFIGLHDQPEFIRKLMYDLNLTFPHFSEELRQARGEDSWFNQLKESETIMRRIRHVPRSSQ